MSATPAKLSVLSPAVAVAVLRHPSLWGTALNQAWRMVPRSGWKHWPPRITPPASYLAFRLQTQHGTGESIPTPQDVVSYLGWCREWNRYHAP